MIYPIDDLQKLAEAHRSRANMTKFSALLDELEETCDALRPWLEKAVEVNELLNAFADMTEEMVDGILPEGVQGQLLDAADVMLRFAPSGSDNLTQFAEFYDGAKDRLETLDDSMEDRSYTAEDRDTMWYEAADQAGNMAVALEELELFGSDPVQTEEDKSVGA